MVQSREPAASGSSLDRAIRTTDPGTGSRTETQTLAQPEGPILTLTGAHDRSRGPRVRWDENVVDNEGMGKKSSKGTFLGLFSGSLLRWGGGLCLSLKHCFTEYTYSLLHLPRTKSNGRI